MFGGFGLYCHGMFFGIIADGCVVVSIDNKRNGGIIVATNCPRAAAIVAAHDPGIEKRARGTVVTRAKVLGTKTKNGLTDAERDEAIGLIVDRIWGRLD